MSRDEDPTAKKRSRVMMEWPGRTARRLKRRTIGRAATRLCFMRISSTTPTLTRSSGLA